MTNLVRNRRWQALVLLRLVVALSSNSTIHPDEHFQNPEIAASLVFNYSSSGNGGDGPLKTWEWVDKSPVRSIIPVWASSGIAFKLLSLLVPHPSGYTLFIAQRLVMFLASVVIDVCLYHITNSCTSSILFASSPVVFTFLVRPFSNSLEAILLALASYTAHLLLTRPLSSTTYALYGLITSIGIFTRVSFLFFTLPLALSILFQLCLPRSTLVRTIQRSLPAVVALGITSILCIASDTNFFRRSLDPRRWTLTPLNLLRYNVATSNLEAHGLHPRYLHVLVNWPMLFGCGLWAAVEAVWPRPRSTSKAKKGKVVLVKGKGSKGKKVVNDAPAINSKGFNGLFLPLSCFLVPTLLLSAQPHQEPRFLLPLIIPLSVLIPQAPFFKLGTTSARRKRGTFWALWIIHSCFFTLLFGYLHQGGLLPSIFRLNEELRSLPATENVDIVFWRTFMPPRHLLLPLSNTTPVVHVTDLSGAHISILLKTLSVSNSTRTILVTPAYAFDSMLSTQLDAARPLFGGETFGIHLDMDRLDELDRVDWRRLGIGAWEVVPRARRR